MSRDLTAFLRQTMPTSSEGDSRVATSVEAWTAVLQQAMRAAGEAGEHATAGGRM